LKRIGNKPNIGGVKLLKVKIFFSSNKEDFEEKINKWCKGNKITKENILGHPVTFCNQMKGYWYGVVWYDG
jgi:hypothetical protein